MKKALYWIALGCGSLIIALYGALFVVGLIFRPFWIPAGSMKPTLLVGDYVMMDRAAYAVKDPERGEVIVFEHPQTGYYFIKRLVGMPGETVQVKEGIVFIDETPLEITKMDPFEEVYEQNALSHSIPRCKSTDLSFGDPCRKDQWRETTPEGYSYPVLDVGMFVNPSQDQTPRFEIPEGHYFFMGDNRDNSRDSRTAQQAGGIGMVPRENLIGQAEWIMFSSAGRSIYTPWTWRSGRYFKAIQ